MASSVIHICVAKEINKVIKRDSKKLIIGTIAPDISKLLGEDKYESHFLERRDNPIPDLEKFLSKYKNNLNDDFVMGYYIHLYVDYIWFKYFITKVVSGNYIKELDGTLIKYTSETFQHYVYNDYSNLNIQLINKYDLDINMFYDERPKIENIITEIPMDKLDLIIDKTLFLMEQAKNGKKYLFETKDIYKFISECSETILKNIKEMGY